jgi:DNA invertase Pin-like site-specific DNA recombinase
MNAIYARARDNEPEDLVQQVARCKARAKARGEHIEAGNIFTDGGEWESGTDRIGLRTLIEGVETGEINKVYVDSLRCLGSSMPVRNLIERWQGKGVEVVIVTQSTTVLQEAHNRWLNSNRDKE